MKNLFVAVLLLIGITGFAQYPPNYTGIEQRFDWLAGKFRDGLHVPGSNGFPASRTKVWVGDGQLMFDSANNRLYVYSNGLWRRLVDSLQFASDTSAKWVTNVYRKQASDSVFFVKGGTPYFAFKDSTGADSVGSWATHGNSGLNATDNWLGHHDSVSLVFKSNAALSGLIDIAYKNTSFGYRSLYSKTSNESNNVAIGAYSLSDSTETGEGNTAVGAYSLAGNSGNENTAVGFSALRVNGNSFYNTAVGYQSLYNNTTGQYNTAVGTHSMLSNTSGEQNAAFGYNALLNNTTGLKNTGIGPAAGENVNSGSFNTLIGHDNFLSLRRGNFNTGLGWLSGPRDTSINNTGNVMIGVQAGRNILYGKHNTFIGTDAGFVAGQEDTVNNSVAIGVNAYTEQSNQLRLSDSLTRITFPGIASGASFDTTNNKPTAMNSTGDLIRMGYWPGSGGGTNIYNSNGSLTGNRTVTMGSNYLRFNGPASTNGNPYMRYNNSGNPHLELVGDGDDVGAANIIMSDLSNPGTAFTMSSYYGAGSLSSSDGSNSGSLILNPGGFGLVGSVGGLAKSIQTMATGIEVTDLEDTVGLYYESNLDSSIAVSKAGDKWIPHVGYVKKLISDSIATVGGGSSYSFSSPLSESAGTVSIQNAAADGSTKGAASFTANDFNSSSGNISIDYTNGQAASSSNKGFLTSADWSTFNGKVGGSGTNQYIATWNGTGTITGSANYSYNGTRVWLATSASGSVTTLQNLEYASGTTGTGVSTQFTTLGGIEVGGFTHQRTGTGQYEFYINNWDGTANAEAIRIKSLGGAGSNMVGIGGVTPSAKLTLPAGSTSIAPMRYTSGSLLSTPVAGAIEFLTDKWYATITTGAARKEITLNDAALTSGVTPVATTNGRLTDGLTLAGTTYTPTLTNVSNVASSTAHSLTVSRTGNSVTVSGKIELQATADATQTEIGVSLPYASNFSTDGQGNGGGGILNGSSAENVALVITSDATNDRISIKFVAPIDGSPMTLSFWFMYRII